MCLRECCGLVWYSLLFRVTAEQLRRVKSWSYSCTLESFPQTVKRVGECEAVIKDLSDHVSGLAGKVHNLENRSRRNILIALCVHEGENETESLLRNKVINDIVIDKMGLVVTRAQRIHRVGKPSTNKPHLLILRFSTTMRTEILWEAKKFRGPKISVWEKCSRRVQNIRKVFWAMVKENRKLEGKYFSDMISWLSTMKWLFGTKEEGRELK